MDKDCWVQEDFEDLIASALIATYETKISNKIEVKKADIFYLRRKGVYIPSNTREVIYNEEKDQIEFDPSLDGMPKSGYIGLGSSDNIKDCEFTGYFTGISFQEVGSLPKGFTRQGAGKIYKQIVLVTGNNGIDGRLGYFTVSKQGNILGCNMHGHDRTGHIVCENSNVITEVGQWGAIAMSYTADSRFSWSITAIEHEAKAIIGCMKEEVKSLLYARSLPASATGRKRPILHLVEAHKRRMKNGTDIDITSFLKGSQTIEMNGTTFIVNPPRAIMNKVSKKSAKYF